MKLLIALVCIALCNGLPLDNVENSEVAEVQAAPAPAPTPVQESAPIPAAKAAEVSADQEPIQNVEPQVRVVEIPEGMEGNLEQIAAEAVRELAAGSPAEAAPITLDDIINEGKVAEGVAATENDEGAVRSKRLALGGIGIGLIGGGIGGYGGGYPGYGYGYPGHGYGYGHGGYGGYGYPGYGGGFGYPGYGHGGYGGYGYGGYGGYGGYYGHRHGHHHHFG